jgi:hypothetical protein
LNPDEGIKFMADIPVDLLEHVWRHWHTAYGLLIAEFLSVAALTAILAVVNPSIAIKITAFIAFGAITLIAWAYTNRLPRTSKNKVGFLISISTGEETQRKRIMEDFVLMVAENPTWGAPRIHGELPMLGIRCFRANGLTLDETSPQAP